MHVDTVIIGAGPGGLACAKTLALQSHNVLVIERKHVIGPKVCAGGVTYGGLISRLPEQLLERSFPKQYIHTPLQHCSIEEDTPIIATVSRKQLGAAMAKQAMAAGAIIKTGVNVRAIDNNLLSIQDRLSKNVETIAYTNLVGADGSSSLVRRYLGLAINKLGIGINYCIDGEESKMQWHLDHKLFANGYAWVFPHKKTISLGAYAPKNSISAAKLKNGLLLWADKQGYDLSLENARAEYINFDFQGWNFGNTFLVGDAAGLASGLTGEGIYPAIISGEQVGATILNPAHETKVMDSLIRCHKKHSTMVRLTGKNKFLGSLLSELVTLGLRSGIVKFNQIEMAP